MERIVKPLLDNHMQVLLLELLAALRLLRCCTSYPVTQSCALTAMRCM